MSRDATSAVNTYAKFEVDMSFDLQFPS